MKKNAQGTWMNFPKGLCLREALDLYILGEDESRSAFVTRLVENAVIDVLETRTFDVGMTLDNLHPGRNMRAKYKALVKVVYDRRNNNKPKEVVQEEYDEEECEEEINVDILREIVESS